jgi:hypothetical protein
MPPKGAKIPTKAPSKKSPAPKKASPKAAVRARSESSDDIMPYPEKEHDNEPASNRGRRTENEDSLELPSRTRDGLSTVVSTTVSNRYGAYYVAIDTDDDDEQDRRERLATRLNARLEDPKAHPNKEVPRPKRATNQEPRTALQLSQGSEAQGTRGQPFPLFLSQDSTAQGFPQEQGGNQFPASQPHRPLTHPAPGTGPDPYPLAMNWSQGQYQNFPPTNPSLFLPTGYTPPYYKPQEFFPQPTTPNPMHGANMHGLVSPSRTRTRSHPPLLFQRSQKNEVGTGETTPSQNSRSRWHAQTFQRPSPMRTTPS